MSIPTKVLVVAIDTGDPGIQLVDWGTHDPELPRDRASGDAAPASLAGTDACGRWWRPGY